MLLCRGFRSIDTGLEPFPSTVYGGRPNMLGMFPSIPSTVHDDILGPSESGIRSVSRHTRPLGFMAGGCATYEYCNQSYVKPETAERYPTKVYDKKEER